MQDVYLKLHIFFDTIAFSLFDKLIVQYGSPFWLHSDQGRNFNGIFIFCWVRQNLLHEMVSNDKNNFALPYNKIWMHII